MFRQLCVSYKLVSVEYYMHEMTPLELDMTVEQLEFADRPRWDATRVLAMYMAAPYSKHKINAKKMFPLPWDKDAEADLMLEEKAFKDQAKKMSELAKTL